MNKLILLLLILALQLNGQTNCSQPIDFNDWIVLGDPSYGAWTVSPDGTSVEQLNNGEPTFFAWNENLINYRIEGDVYVNTTIGDEDYVGAAFGVQLPNQLVFDEYKMWLFDWKRDTQYENSCDVFGEAGFTFNKIDGSIPVGCAPFETRHYFWGHNSDALFNVLDTQYGLQYGWTPYVNIHLVLEYTLTGARVIVDGDTIFNETGCFDSGYFALYNYSQDHVVYKDFTYSFKTGFLIDPDMVCLGDTSQMTLLCAENIDYDITSIDTVKWDFGDGDNLVVSDISYDNINPSHYYQNPGTYEVELIVIDDNNCTDTARSTTVIWDSLYVSIPDTTLCEGSSFTVEFTPDITPLWWDGSSDASKTFSASGDYWVEISRGPCIERDSFTITNETLPLFNIGPTDTIMCNTDTLILDAHADNGLTYIWQDNSNNETFMVTQLGDYAVTVTNICGESEDSISVEYFTPSDYFTPDNTICAGEVMTVSFPTDIMVVWYDNTTNSTHDFTEAGLYWVDITKGMCTERDSFIIDVETTPVFNLGPLDTTICNMDTLVLNAHADNGTSYSWQDNSINETMTVTAPGMYAVTVTNACGTSSDSINVNYFTPSDYFIEDFTLCTGDTQTIVMPINTFILWSDNTNDIAKIFTDAGTYWVTIGRGPCIETDTFIISSETMPLINIGPQDTSLCSGDILVLDASAPNATDYIWSDNTMSSMLTVTQSGTYSVDVTNICGTSSDTIDISYLQDQFGLDFGFTDTLLCADVELYLDYPFDEATDYLWSTGDMTSDVVIDENGTYQLTVSNKCIEESDTFNVVFEGDSPIVALEYDDAIQCVGNTLNIEGVLLNTDSYFWSTNDTGLVISVNSGGTYTLTGQNVCGSVSADAIVVYEICDAFTIPNIFSPNGDGLNDNFGPYNVNYAIENYKLVIFDRWGNPVFTTKDVNALWDGKKDGTDVPPDVYIYIINYDDFNGNPQVLHGDVTVVK